MKRLKYLGHQPYLYINIPRAKEPYLFKKSANFESDVHEEDVKWMLVQYRGMFAEAETEKPKKEKRECQPTSKSQRKPSLKKSKANPKRKPLAASKRKKPEQQSEESPIGTPAVEESIIESTQEAPEWQEQIAANGDL